MTSAAFSCDIARSTRGSTTSPTLTPRFPEARARIFSTAVAPTSGLDRHGGAVDPRPGRQGAGDGLAHFGARGGPAHVVRADLPFAQDARDRGLDGARLRGLAEPLEHHLRGQDRRDRIDLVLAGVFRGRAVGRLEDAELRPDVARAAA